MTVTDRIEKTVFLGAPRHRVWRAISESKRFGAWIGLEIDTEFTPGTLIEGRMAPTAFDPEFAKVQEPYRGLAVEFIIDRMEPPRLLSLCWHPFAVGSPADYAGESRTQVVFHLDEVTTGTRLTITESGFDQLPLERRRKAFEVNDNGWAQATRLLEKYLHATE
jgi:uncharacterized protein YndB with AHSA1/START domain